MKKAVDITRAEMRRESTTIEGQLTIVLRKSLQDADNLWEFADMVDQDKSAFLAEYIVVDSVEEIAEKDLY